MNFQDVSPYLNIILTVGLAIGGIFAWRSGYSQAAGKIQESVIAGLKEEVDMLRRKVDDLDKERSTQDRVIATIRYVLKQYGLRITIAGDVVTVNDSAGTSKSMRVQDRASVKPLVHDDNDDSDVS